MPEFITDWSSFRYCPKCGSGDMRFHGKKLFCRACSFTYYINPALAVGALIVDDQDRLLVVTRGNAPAQGDIPATRRSRSNFPPTVSSVPPIASARCQRPVGLDALAVLQDHRRS